MVGRGYGDYFFVEGDEGLEPVQTLVRSAANGGKDPEVIDAAHVHFYMKGGLQTFAASARALGQSGESGRSMRGQIHKFCKRSNGDKPTLTDAALSTNGCFGDAAGAILHDCKSHVSLSDHERVNLKA